MFNLYSMYNKYEKKRTHNMKQFPEGFLWGGAVLCQSVRRWME